MNELQVMDRYRKEVIQVSKLKHDINVQYLYDSCIIVCLVRVKVLGKSRTTFWKCFIDIYVDVIEKFSVTELASKKEFFSEKCILNMLIFLTFFWRLEMLQRVWLRYTENEQDLWHAYYCCPFWRVYFRYVVL